MSIQKRHHRKQRRLLGKWMKRLEILFLYCSEPKWNNNWYHGTRTWFHLPLRVLDWLTEAFSTKAVGVCHQEDLSINFYSVQLSPTLSSCAPSLLDLSQDLFSMQASIFSFPISSSVQTHLWPVFLGVPSPHGMRDERSWLKDTDWFSIITKISHQLIGFIEL